MEPSEKKYFESIDSELKNELMYSVSYVNSISCRIIRYEILAENNNWQ